MHKTINIELIIDASEGKVKAKGNNAQKCLFLELPLVFLGRSMPFSSTLTTSKSENENNNSSDKTTSLPVLIFIRVFLLLRPDSLWEKCCNMGDMHITPYYA